MPFVVGRERQAQQTFLGATAVHAVGDVHWFGNEDVLLVYLFLVQYQEEPLLLCDKETAIRVLNEVRRCGNPRWLDLLQPQGLQLRCRTRGWRWRGGRW